MENGPLPVQLLALSLSGVWAGVSRYGFRLSSDNSTPSDVRNANRWCAGLQNWPWSDRVVFAGLSHFDGFTDQGHRVVGALERLPEHRRFDTEHDGGIVEVVVAVPRAFVGVCGADGGVQLGF